MAMETRTSETTSGGMPAVAPAMPKLGLEAYSLSDLAYGLLAAPALALQPRGRGEPVMVLPGFGAGDRATVLIRRYLRHLGYRARGWRLGRNGGNVPLLIPRVIDEVARFTAESGRPVVLVGWSLGGTLAREVARERPELVEKVITLGTPVIGGPKYTSVAGVYERQGYDLAEIEAYVEERDRVTIRVPVTAIFSKRDGVVSWQACIDRTNPQVDHVEIRSSHLGMLFSSGALRNIASSLRAA